MSEQTFIIVGASLAGAKAAEELRTQGFDGRLLLIGSEPERPYERPPLTKDYLRGESEREKTYVHEQGFYEDHQILLEADSTVTAIDPGGRASRSPTGARYDYDRLLLATGAEPRRIPIAGAELGGVHYLRTLQDCDALRERLDTGGRVVGRRRRLDRQRVRGLGAPDAASTSRSSIRSRCPTSASSAQRSAPSTAMCTATTASSSSSARASRHSKATAAVARVRTTSGRMIECDFVVVGIGVRAARRASRAAPALR